MNRIKEVFHFVGLLGKCLLLFPGFFITWQLSKFSNQLKVLAFQYYGQSSFTYNQWVKCAAPPLVELSYLAGACFYMLIEAVVLISQPLWHWLK